MSTLTPTAALLYLPVIHKGYLDFVTKLPNETTLFILDEKMIVLIDTQFDYLRKEIRALTPLDAITSLRSLFPKRTISLLDPKKLLQLNTETQNIVLPKEDIFLWLAEKKLSKAQITYDTTFLRWNRANTLTEHVPHSTVAATFEAADQSSDWWRQVGCALVKNGQILSVAHNQQLPSPYTPYIDSDPRNSFHKGKHIELSTAIHAEAALIANAAKKGVSLNEAELYVTTFPCPVCAKLIACSGISKLFFSEGYSMLDGETILIQAGVTISQLP